MFLPMQEQRLQLERRTQIFEGIVKRAKNAVNMQIYDVPVIGEICLRFPAGEKGIISIKPISDPGGKPH